MATFYNTTTAENQQEVKDEEHWFFDNNHLKQQNELYNIVPSNTTSNSTTTTATTATNDFNLDSYPWSIKPLSPPMAKNEQTTTTTSPVSYRPSTSTSHSGVAWHALWSSSTWQNSNATTAAATEPQKRSRSFSSMQVPSSYYDTSPTADDYFYRAHRSSIGSGQQDYSSFNKSPLPSPLASSGFMANDADKTSIWSFDYNNNPLMRLDDRRHSIAVTQQHYVRPITPPPSHPLQQRPKQKQQQQYPVQHLVQQLQQQQIDEYFSPTTAAIDVQYLGKGLPIDQLEPGQTVYLVQFKGDYRSDWFYVQHDDKIRIQLNEMVIVEADRGYDLGKVIDTSQTSCLEKGVTSVKRIFRHANPAELATHQLKQQDEHKALVICQAKIKQKNLNMEVVDAEYQWDRRKLTFYFKANERIDFRELVRELFKIYKTRIWMCAYASVDH
ncbi:uncharacterized protein ATC70_005302 [Mucor velutinosus]|uniref:PSP1 C-terminal domain-containing protein n=1 Tax=Mucor velutinosus TaxID=708070 RepID=A0AAN7D5J4_9FUNG|nr:hypothetical protein ATC70_005302 [Mucor velutinosus]